MSLSKIFQNSHLSWSEIKKLFLETEKFVEIFSHLEWTAINLVALPVSFLALFRAICSQLAIRADGGGFLAAFCALLIFHAWSSWSEQLIGGLKGASAWRSRDWLKRKIENLSRSEISCANRGEQRHRKLYSSPSQTRLNYREKKKLRKYEERLSKQFSNLPVIFRNLVFHIFICRSLVKLLISRLLTANRQSHSALFFMQLS